MTDRNIPSKTDLTREWIKRAALLLPLVPRHALSQLAAEVTWLLQNEAAASPDETTARPDPLADVRWICDNCGTVNGIDDHTCLGCRKPKQVKTAGEPG